VTDGILADVPIQMRLEESTGDSLFFCQKRFNPFIGSAEVISARDDLNPITRGQENAFLDGFSIDQPTQGGFQQRVAKRQPFTHFDWGAVMVQPDQ